MKITVNIDDQTFEVEIDDLHARPIKATIGDKTFEVWPEEQNKAELASTATAPVGPPARVKPPTASNEKEVCAPIPGVILEIKVKAGDSVSHGQELLILEAMKMKNSIRANRDGQIAEIHVAGGASVVHGQNLISFKD